MQYVIHRGDGLVMAREQGIDFRLSASLNPYFAEQGYFRWREGTFRLSLDDLLRSATRVDLFSYSDHLESLNDFGQIRIVSSNAPKAFLEMEIRFWFSGPYSANAEPCLDSAACEAAVDWAGTATISKRFFEERRRLESIRPKPYASAYESILGSDRDAEVALAEGRVLIGLLAEYDSILEDLADGLHRRLLQ